MNDLIKFKRFDLRYLHIAIIILGSIFISLSAFHSNLWFDESYSVGIANHSFKDIWIIGGSDVHPVLYYCILHVLNLIFGNNILVYRIFSMVCTALLGIIGFTHVRKDFGEKVGLIFSFLVFLFPVNLVYSGEIRMYSLAMLLVTLTAIYAYRIYKKTDKNNHTNVNIKNWLIFAVCSLASAYTHYYALMASGLINLFLLVGLFVNCVKNTKSSKNEGSKGDSIVQSLFHDKNIIAFIVSAIVQILLYIPWLLSLLTQMGQVSKGFWIGIHFPDTLIELFTFQFTGNLGGSNYVSTPIAIVWSLIVTVYMFVLYFKDKIFKTGSSAYNQEIMKPAILALWLFLGIALAACIVSLVIWRPIIYARYMLCVMGLFIFFLAFSMAKKGHKYINFIVCTISMFICLFININFINTNYDESNAKPISFVKEDIKNDDIILLNNYLNGFVVAVNFPENSTYFYDEENWNCEKAYRAFANDFKTVYDLDFLKNFSGRIWVTNDDVLKQIQDNYDTTLIKHERFSTQYKNNEYSISLIELKK